jgi:hypothetical protein
MKLTHDFVLLHNTGLRDILTGTTTLAEFLKKLRTYAAVQQADALADGASKETALSVRLKTIGDGFESFGEAFIRLCGRHDPRIYITDLQPRSDTDNGVDAEGFDTKTGQRVFIQFKCYREDEFLTGTRSHLDSFVAEVLMRMWDLNEEGQDLGLKPRMIVITSAADIHRYTKEQKYRNRVECFPHKTLHNLTDSSGFWADFLKII